jgi:ribosome-associated protein
MTESTAAKKDTQRLQRAIVEGLEDVKAQDIRVFNTEHLSPLFERVIVASGSSNRQTKALAASVRDAVREAGFGKPRIEGEDNGEWIIVDCGAAVAHIMQPAIRSYYQLEEIWGEKPVRLKLGAPKPFAQAESARDADTAKKKPVTPSLRRSSAAVKGQRAADAAAKEGQPKRKSAGKSAPKSSARPAGKAVAKPAARKSAAPATPASAVSRLAAGKAAPAKKVAAKPAPAKSAAKPAAKPAARKAAPAAKKPR